MYASQKVLFQVTKIPRKDLVSCIAQIKRQTRKGGVEQRKKVPHHSPLPISVFHESTD